MSNKAKSYRCKICGRNFSLKISLEVHTLSHKENGVSQVRSDEIIPEVNFGNDLAIRELKIDRRLRESKEFEKQSKTYKCITCGKDFALKICWKTHIVECKGRDSSPVVCKEEDTVLCRSSSIPITLPTDNVGSVVDPSRNDVPVVFADACSLADSSSSEIVLPNPKYSTSSSCSSSEIVLPNPKYSTSSSKEKYRTISVKSFENLCSQISVAITETSKEGFDCLEDLEKADSFSSCERDITKSDKSIAQPKETVDKCKVEPSVSSDDDDQMESFSNCVEIQENQTTHVDKLCKIEDGIQNVFDPFKEVEKKSAISEYICVVCKDGFDSSSVLKEHMELGNYQCSECDENFPECVLLKNHKVSHFIHQCPTCKETFSSRDLLGDHCNPSSYNCVLCKATFSSCSDAKSHKEAHDKTGCWICKEIFPSKEALDYHKTFCELLFDSCAGVVKQHSELSSPEVISQKKCYKCTSCSESFPSYKDLMLHHESNSKFHCSKCEKKMCSDKALRKHNERKSFNCFLCAETFTSCEDLFAHRKSHSKRVCFKCKRVFPTKQSATLHATQKNHICEICNEIFTKCKSLKSHMISHGLKCKFCQRSFLYLNTLHKHESKHSMEELRCEHCGQEFSNVLKVKMHVKRVHIPKIEVLCALCGKIMKECVYRTHECLLNSGVEKLQCDKCGISFIKKARHEAHMKLHGGGVRFHCRFCKEGFIFKRNLIVHLRSHAGEKPFSCNDCGKKFTTKYNLDLHYQSHNTENKPFKCHVCFREFRIALALNQHLRTHFPSQERPYRTCKVCSKDFRFSYTLSQHYMKHTKEEREMAGVFNVKVKYKSKPQNPKKRLEGNSKARKKFECRYCGKKFASTILIESHENEHTGEKPYKCSVCEKEFYGSHLLKQHIRIHSDHRPYQCSVCDKSFYIKSKLEQHMRIHSDDRPYKCSVCDKSYCVKTHLTLHMRIHTGEKPYECQVCDKAFHRKQALVRHTRTHTGERPYMCEICHKTFTQYAHAKSHILIHTGEKPHQCDLCGAAFALKSNMVQHRKIHLKNKGT